MDFIRGRVYQAVDGQSPALHDVTDPALRRAASDLSYDPMQPYASPPTYATTWSTRPETKILPTVNTFDGITTPSKSFKSEPPKAVLKKGFNLLSYWVHLLAVIITALVVQLSFREVFIGDQANFKDNPWAMKLDSKEFGNVMQFVAKIHEILIVGSASAIVFNIIRRRLIGHRGVPLGLLVGGYQLSSAEYLLSGGFWGPVTYAWKHRKGGLIALTVVVGWTIVYANVVGPSTAVVLVPTLTWFDVADPFGNGEPLHSYIGQDPRITWPDVLDANYPYIPDIMTRESSYSYSVGCYTANMTSLCPGYGHQELKALSEAHALEGIRPSTSVRLNYGRARRQLEVNRTGSEEESIMFASTLHSDVADLAGLFWHYVRDGNESRPIRNMERVELKTTPDSQVFSPVVQVQCNHYDYYDAYNGKVDVVWPTRLLDGWRTSPGEEGPIVPVEMWNPDEGASDDPSMFHWVGLNEFDTEQTDFKASIGAFSVVPVVRPFDDGTITNAGDTRTIETDWLLVPCVISARWAATELIFDPVSSDLIHSNITSDSIMAKMGSKKERAEVGLSEPIAIEPDWANLLNVPGLNAWSKNKYEFPNSTAMDVLFWNYIVYEISRNVTNRDTEEVILQEGVSYFQPPEVDLSGKYDTKVAESVAGIISLVVADGLSRVSYEFPRYWTMTEFIGDTAEALDLYEQAGQVAHEGEEFEAAALEGWALTSFKVTRFGWGYNMKSKTTIFAVSVLFLHASIAVVYMIYGVYHWIKCKWCCESWGDVGELLTLAMLSRQPIPLEGTSAGINEWDTWRLDCRVRESGLDRIELVVGQDVEQAVLEDLPVRGKKYR